MASEIARRCALAMQAKVEDTPVIMLHLDYAPMVDDAIAEALKNPLLEEELKQIYKERDTAMAELATAKGHLDDISEALQPHSCEVGKLASAAKLVRERERRLTKVAAFSIKTAAKLDLVQAELTTLHQDLASELERRASPGGIEAGVPFYGGVPISVLKTLERTLRQVLVRRDE